MARRFYFCSSCAVGFGKTHGSTIDSKEVFYLKLPMA